MPNSSSKVRLALSRPPRDVRLALADRARPVATSPGPDASSRTPEPAVATGESAASDAVRRHFDIKELQRRAFERGRTVERERLAGPMSDLMERLARAEATREAAAAEDRGRVESFAVSLALAVAERLTHALVAHREHDVRAMVTELLERCSGTGQDEGDFQLALDPEDHARLMELGADIPPQVTLIGDATLGPGDLRLRGRHHETWARLSERFDEVRRSFNEEAGMQSA